MQKAVRCFGLTFLMILNSWACRSSSGGSKGPEPKDEPTIKPLSLQDLAGLSELELVGLASGSMEQTTMSCTGVIMAKKVILTSYACTRQLTELRVFHSDQELTLKNVLRNEDGGWGQPLKPYDVAILQVVTGDRIQAEELKLPEGDVYSFFPAEPQFDANSNSLYQYVIGYRSELSRGTRVKPQAERGIYLDRADVPKDSAFDLNRSCRYLLGAPLFKSLDEGLKVVGLVSRPFDQDEDICEAESGYIFTDFTDPAFQSTWQSFWERELQNSN
jgi:hypothetical protein